MQGRLDSNGKWGHVCSDENSFSEGHLRNAPLLFRRRKSSSADSLTCKRTDGSAGSHTLACMLHLEEMEGVEGGADDERGGRRSCSALGEQAGAELRWWGESERNGEKRSLIALAASSSDSPLLCCLSLSESCSDLVIPGKRSRAVCARACVLGGGGIMNMQINQRMMKMSN